MSGFNLKLLFVCLVVSLVFFSNRAEAVGFFNPGSMATQVVNGVNATLNKVSTIANKVVKGTLNKLKALVDKFTSRFNKKEETKIPGTKEIKESKIADIYDENSIRPAFQKLFFEYPSDQERIQLLYDDKRREFYDDTIIEAFTAVRELEKNLVKIDKKIAAAGTTYTKADDYNGGLYNNYMIEVETDELMMIIQELVAIKAQMAAASAMRDKVKPLYHGKASVGIQLD